MPRIALVGLPGSGKSTVSRCLGRLLQCPVLDTDAVIEEYIACSISEFFEREGEAAFRDLESDTLAQALGLAHEKTVVLATGGGIVLRPSNRQLLREQAFTVYLHAQPGQLHQRLRHDRSRPLLQNTDMLAKIKALYAQRHGLYKEVASCCVESADCPPLSVAEKIVQQLLLAFPEFPLGENP